MYRQPLISKEPTLPQIKRLEPTKEKFGGALVERIAIDIANDIIVGAYQPGDRIIQEDLAERYDVSLGPIREALLRLEKDQMIEIVPRRGARVAQLTNAHVEDLLAIRLAVFPVLVRAALLRGTDAQLAKFCDEVRILIEQLGRGDSASAVATQSEYCGQLLHQAGGADWAGEILMNVSKKLRWVANRLTIAEQKERELAASAWTLLIPAVAQRDFDKANLAADQIILRSVRAILPKFYREHGLDDTTADQRLNAFLGSVGSSLVETLGR
jgi:DNA-binding GntR family transcriptional regulator